MGEKRVIVDGDADIPSFLEDKVVYVPQYVIYDGNSYKATKDFMLEKMENMLDPEKLSTSMPSVGDFKEGLKQLELPALVIHVSSGISSAYASIVAAAESLGIMGKLYIFDSKTAAAGIGNYVYLAIQLLEEGKTIDDVYQRLIELRDRRKEKTYAIVGDVRFAIHGGRVKGLAASAAKLMHFTPVVSPDQDGYIQLVHKTLGRKKAIRYILKEVDSLLSTAKRPFVGISHAWSLTEAMHIREYVINRRPDAKTFITNMNATLIAHGGKGTLSVSILDAGI